MKKVLAFALVALLAASAVFAGVNFSGRFRAGYTFTFQEGGVPINPWKDGEGKLTIKATDDNKIWTINFKGAIDNATKLDSDEGFKANASINVANLVKYLGGDMGDFKMTFSAGNNGDMTALSVFNDKSGDEYYKFKNEASNSVQFAMGYGDIINFNIAGDPTWGDGKVASIVVSASSEPIDGLGISLAYAFNGTQKTYTLINPTETAEGDAGAGGTLVEEFFFANGINAAFDVNIASMCGLDFDLGVTAWDTFAINAAGDNPNQGVLESGMNFNALHAGIYGGIDLINAYAEFRMGTIIGGNDAGSGYGMEIGVASSCGLDGFGLSAKFEMPNFKAAEDFLIGATATYDLGDTGLTLELGVEYANAIKACTITPKMIIVF